MSLRLVTSETLRVFEPWLLSYRNVYHWDRRGVIVVERYGPTRTKRAFSLDSLVELLVLLFLRRWNSLQAIRKKRLMGRFRDLRKKAEGIVPIEGALLVYRPRSTLILAREGTFFSNDEDAHELAIGAFVRDLVEWDMEGRGRWRHEPIRYELGERPRLFVAWRRR